MWQMAKNKSIGISEILKTRIPAFAIHFYKSLFPVLYIMYITGGQVVQFLDENRCKRFLKVLRIVGVY